MLIEGDQPGSATPTIGKQSHPHVFDLRNIWNSTLPPPEQVLCPNRGLFVLNLERKNQHKEMRRMRKKQWEGKEEEEKQGEDTNMDMMVPQGATASPSRHSLFL